MNNDSPERRALKRMGSGPACTLVSVQGVGEVIHTNDPNQISVAWVPGLTLTYTSVGFSCFNKAGGPP